MLTAIGECIDAWSHVEVTLICIFRNVSGTDPQLSDLLLTEPQGFATRLKMIDRGGQFKLAKTTHVTDWKLLCGHARTLSSLRNQVAHATMFNANNEFFLRPYFLSAKAKPDLSIVDVKNITSQFLELASALDWFDSTVINP